jgi:hypothetical protein
VKAFLMRLFPFMGGRRPGPPPANGRKPRKPKKNLCCRYIGKAAWIALPVLGIVHMNINYCPLCGRPINRDEPCDMTVKKG